jgi:hypothetical protein
MSSPKPVPSTQDEWLQLKKEELKEEARKRLLPCTGNKIDLVFGAALVPMAMRSR